MLVGVTWNWVLIICGALMILAEVMLQYRQNKRPGGDTLMSAALYGLPEADFKALAHYFSRLK